MLEYDFQNSLGYWICTAAHHFERSMNQELVPEQITYRQCQVLACLALEGSMSQVALAERMKIEPPTLVRVLDRMERDGLIARDDCPGDRRRKMIRALPKARPVWKRIIACAERVRAKATHGLTAQQLKTLKQLLERVQLNLREDKALEESA
jgi:MarR family transcriptional regulator for hemolysin